MQQPIPCGPPFDSVLFDCDSTLSAVEGIDELARRAGVHAAVVPLTEAAMAGTLTLEQVYAQRLQLIRPHLNDIAWLAGRYLDAVVSGAGHTIAVLQALHKAVYIVSGGLREAILPLARQLNVAQERVHAVQACWDDVGNYIDFDRDSPLTRSQGKARICERIVAPMQRAALVGDGGTDIEAAEAGIYVLGFGGVVCRPNVVARAHHFVRGPSLDECLPYLLTAEEQERSQCLGS